MGGEGRGNCAVVAPQRVEAMLGAKVRMANELLLEIEGVGYVANN
ncbi:MAG: hypothetical protein SVP26_03730 [Chloroflexota bacterium]|nr:hypothetical protein [Chloroflexota bacterium]